MPGDTEWEHPYPFDLISLESAKDWSGLEAAYSRAPETDATRLRLSSDRPFRRCLEVARAGGAKTVVVETRYVDVDYRSEYTAFYSRAFQSFPDSTRRLHFFRTSFGPDDVWSLVVHEGDYLGFIVVRPSVPSVVGRAMLAPPPDLREAIRTAVSEEVNFFGRSLAVSAVPFMQQDARLGACAHAATWVCHCTSFLAHRGVARRPVSDFALHANPSLAAGRPVPSSGLTVLQVSDLLRTFDLPPLHYDLAKLTDEDRPTWWKPKQTDNVSRTTRLCCRYLNSGLPLIATVQVDRLMRQSGGGLHAVVVCGYYRRPNAPRGHVGLVVHDDMRGPYLAVDDLTKDIDEEAQAKLTWRELLAPLPEKLWMSGDTAERVGCENFIRASQVAVREGIQGPQRLVDLYDSGNLSIRTYAITNNRFKRRIRRNCADPIVVREYSHMRLPRHVWVVEAVDRSAREQGVKECVLGEIVFDATSDDHHPVVLATRVPGFFSAPRPDDSLWDSLSTTELIRSSGQLFP